MEAASRVVAVAMEEAIILVRINDSNGARGAINQEQIKGED
jgi:hypothetical protein